MRLRPTCMKPLVTTLMGATLCVSDIDRAARQFCQALGWHRLGEGPIGPAEKQAWGIASGHAGDRYIMLGATAARRGFLRLVSGREPSPVALELRRRGWSSIEMVVQDVDVLYERVQQAEGFSIISSPESVDLTRVDSLLHRSFVARGPGHVSSIFTQALGQPKGRGFPTAAGLVGMIFNVVLRTDAFSKTQELYVDGLGMQPFLNIQLHNANFNSLLKLPLDTRLEITMVKGDAPGTGEGSIELQGYLPGLLESPAGSSDQFASGLAMVTYTSHDIEAAYRAAVAAGADVLSPPVDIESPLYEGGQSFALCGSMGERLEIIQEQVRLKKSLKSVC